MRAAFAVVLLGCVPQPQPTYFQQQPGYQQPPGQAPPPPQAYAQPYAAPAPAPAPAPAAQALSCRDTLGCYMQANPPTQQAMAQCDQRTTPDNANNAHAAANCLIQSGCSDNNCIAQRCGAQFSTCLGQTVAAQQPQQPAQQQPAPASGTIDLAYQVPAGWQELRMIPNAITLQYEHQQAFMALEQDRLHIYPSRPLTGSITDTYHALWNELVAPNFKTNWLQGPLRRRLASGYGVAMDASPGSLGAAYTTVGLYLIYTDNRVVPIVSTGLQAAAEPALVRFFDAVTIRGFPPPTRKALFDTNDLVGQWSTGATAVASYVNSSGAVVGDASVASAQKYTFEANGTYQSQLLSVAAAGASGNDRGTGKWHIEDDMLVLQHGNSTDKIRIWGHGTAPKGNADSICMPTFGQQQPRFFSPPDGINTSWFGRVR